MAREGKALLDSGDVFPGVEIQTVQGEILRLPDYAVGKWAVLLFYRGDWWRYCRQQLLDYQTHIELLKKLDIIVVAASTDPQETAIKTIEGLKLTFSIGYGLDAKAISEKIGAYYDAKSLYLHATSFLLKPNSMVFNAVYSSLAIGRLGPQEVESLVEIVRSRKGD